MKRAVLTVVLLAGTLLVTTFPHGIIQQLHIICEFGYVQVPYQSCKQSAAHI